MEKALNRPRLATFNLVALSVVGTAASFWVLYFTDVLPIVTSLLGLGGVFAWVAFLLNALPLPRKEYLRDIFDVYCLQSYAFLFLIGVLPLAVALRFAPARGTLIIDNLEARDGRVVSVYALDANRAPKGFPLRRVPVPAGGRVKVLVPTDWAGSRTYYVKPTGLPAARLTARCLRRETVVVPQQFQEQPVILVRPAASIITAPNLTQLRLEVLEQRPTERTTRRIASQPYWGGSLWIGADESVVIPQSVVDRWEFELALENLDTRGVLNWLQPVAVAPNAELGRGSTIVVNLLRPDDTVAFSARVEIPSNGKIPMFPKEAVLR